MFSLQSSTRILLLFLLASVAAAKEQVNFALPSFTIDGKVSVHQDDHRLLIQNRLDRVVHQHLFNYFVTKLRSMSSEDNEDEQVVVNEVDLASSLLWKELVSTNSHALDTQMDDNSTIPVERDFEIRAVYNAEISVSSTSDKNSHYLSAPIMDLLLLDAFQGTHYWDLMHLFMTDDLLLAIEVDDIDVVTDGFVQNPNYAGGNRNHIPTVHDPNLIQDSSSSLWTMSMIIGVGLAGFFLLALLAMWGFLWFRNCQRRRRSKQQKNGKQYYKGGSAASSTSKTDHSSDLESNFSDEESQSSTGSWMDHYAKALTSIPLREPNKNKKKNATRAAGKISHPGKRYQLSLQEIVEENDEDVMSVISSQTKKSTQSKTRPSSDDPMDDIINLALTRFQEQQERAKQQEDQPPPQRYTDPRAQLRYESKIPKFK